MTNLIGISGRAGSGKDLIASIIQYLIWKNKIELGELTNYTQTLEDFIRRSHNSYLIDWEVIKFADKLKDIVCLLTGCTRADLEDQEFKSNHKFRFENKWYGSVREFLQYFGTDLIRKNLGDNIWVDATFVDYKPKKLSEYNPSKWIISDVRFPNEIEAIKDRGGIVIRVNRDTEYLKCIEDPAYFVETYVKVNNEKIELREYKKDFIRKHCKPTKEHESETALDDYDNFDYIINNNGTIEELTFKVREILVKENII